MARSRDIFERLLDALRERLVRTDRRFRIGNRFEACSNFQVERERSVSRRMRKIALKIETPTSRIIGTDRLDDRPRLIDLSRKVENAVNLVTTGESSSVKKDFACGILLQQIAPNVEHNLHYKVILLDGVFDIFRREQSRANQIFADDSTITNAGKFPSESRLAGTRQPRHEDNHVLKL